MKQGVVYALFAVVGVLIIVILFQQWKLSALRDANATLQTDARALITTRGAEAAAAAELQRELRELRAEHERLREEVERARGTKE